MALEAGGYAEKMGHRYEANWIAFQLLQLLEEKINWVMIEPIGDDEVGVDIVIKNNQEKLEHHQCKASKGNSEHWTFSQLNESRILQNAQFQISRGPTEFHVVSPLTGTNINDLCDSALNSNGIPKDFIQYQINASQKRQNDFKDLCRYLDLDNTNDSDILKAMHFLKNFRIFYYPQDGYHLDILKSKSASLFFGEPIKLINFLKNHPEDFNRLRNKITLSDLLIDLESNGFKQKITPDDRRISSTIAQLSTEFTSTIEPFLISNTLISRNELQDVIISNEENAVTLIKAEAGMGKSALLLELHNFLQDNNVISIPIRLDRRRPENSIDHFGKSLGFPYSPVQAVNKFASHQKVVFILDQLDAIRWTAAHSYHALEVCKELVRQIIYLRKEGINISIVLASRSFDLNEDVALSSWLESIAENRKDIQLSVLDDETIKNSISPYENYFSLTEDKQKTLKIPLWLGIYLSIAERIKIAPQFNNKLELIKGFWENRLQEVSSYDITEHNATKFIDEIVGLMLNKGLLSISKNLLPTGSQRLLRALISIGLLNKQNQQISFRHQSLFDYQVGMKLFIAGSTSPQQLLFEIGNLEEQTLTKREYLRYALTMLLEGRQSQFSNCVEAILFSDKVRFHLKHLTLNVIRETNSLKSPLKRLINNIVSEQKYLRKFLRMSCYGNSCIIGYLIQEQKISEWLRSSDDELVNIALNLLRTILKNTPEVVIDEIKNFIGQSKEWNKRIYQVLPRHMEDDPDEVFELRKELINLGCKVHYINWGDLGSVEHLK